MSERKEQLLTIAEAARLAKIPIATLSAAILRGRIPFKLVMVPKKKVRLSDVRKYVRTVTLEKVRLDFLRRFTERSLMQYETRGVEPQNRGPIVICVDESGSMSGQPEAEAKALSLAMLWIARHQRRDCVCIGFGSDSEPLREFRFPNGRSTPEQLSDWIGNFLNGGTDFEKPLGAALKHVDAMQRRGDIIFVTDGVCRVSEPFMAAFKSAKRARAIQCIGIVVGAGDGGPLQQLCDRVHVVGSLSVANSATRDAISV